MAMSERLNYECYIVTPGESIDLDNGESVVCRHPHDDGHTLIVWTESKELTEEPLELLESTGDAE